MCMYFCICAHTFVMRMRSSSTNLSNVDRPHSLSGLVRCNVFEIFWFSGHRNGWLNHMGRFSYFWSGEGVRIILWG